MKMFKLLAVVFVLMFAMNAGAQTSVYFCSSTGAIGYCYGSREAANCAYNKCVSYGGTSPYQVFSTYSKGYGAVAVGYNAYGRRVVGASGGFSYATDARQAAINACISYGGTNPSVYDSWNDY